MWGLPAIFIRYRPPPTNSGTCRMTLGRVAGLRASLLDRCKTALLLKSHLSLQLPRFCSRTSSHCLASIVKSDDATSIPGHPVSCRSRSSYLWREPQLPQSIPPSSELGSIHSQSQQTQRWRSSSDLKPELHTWGCFRRSLSQFRHSLDEMRPDAG